MRLFEIIEKSSKTNRKMNFMICLIIFFLARKQLCKAFYLVDIETETPEGEILIWLMFYSFCLETDGLILEETIRRQCQQVSDILPHQICRDYLRMRQLWK